ncbi:uroporphyrin-III methyltransferase [Photobacterium aquae]|uniref:uroporphyrinogen-III C-methyltransferase n=1 Tax=Photobacterium aquae TaxID=1195763 RepID=A0A0J1GYH8_9GAMM|nr:uroporphyrin-III methyltransferase [Photobacterium aquae]
MVAYEVSADVRTLAMKRGCVDLVGAGPGDPMLLTLKALQSIELAEVIVYDKLVSEAIRERFPAQAELVYVGKAKGQHSLSQDEINRLLVKLALQGKRVCRLKGGDAFIFGRGSEEILVLKKFGIPVSLVPGITAATGCGAYAGIPMTHRGVSQGCTFVTAHTEKDSPINWQALVQLSHTLVFYMGVSKADEIAQQLLAAGAKAEMPVAVIENGCCPEQRTFTGTLVNLASLVSGNQVEAPALIVIGEVVALSEQLQWVVSMAETQEYLPA